MFRSRCATTAFLSTLFFLSCPVPLCFANVLVPHWTTPALIDCLSWLLAFAFNVIIEFSAVYVVISRPSVTWWRVLAVVSFANLITFPLAQLAWLHVIRPDGGPLDGPHLVWSIVLVEAGVVFAEFLLLKSRFDRLWHRGVLEKPVGNVRLCWAALTANAASFGIGLVALGGGR